MGQPLKNVDVEFPRAGVAVVTFAGAHDVGTSAVISELLEDLIQANELVVADFSSARFIDSSMLKVLFAAEKRASELDKILSIRLGTN